MNSGATSGSIATTLHRNPFAILGASLTSTRSEINKLAEDKAFTLDEAVVQGARRALTNPRARLTAEVGWLFGVSEPAIQKLISGNGLDEPIIISADILPLTRANVLAAYVESHVYKNVSQQWLRTQLSILFQLAEQVEVGAVEVSLNASRKVAGFPEINRVQLTEAISEQRAYYLNMCQRLLTKFSPGERGEVLSLFQNAPSQNGGLLHMLVDEYEFSSRAEIETKAESIAEETKNIRTFPSIANVRSPRLIELLTAYGAVVRPVLTSREQRGLDHDLTISMFHEVRELAIELANNHQDFESSLKITTALHGVTVVVARLNEQLTKDLETLSRLRADREQHLQELRVASSVSNAHLPSRAAHSWPEEPGLQTLPPNSVGTKSFWNRIPVWVKFVIALMLLGWGSDAVMSNTDDDTVSQSRSSRSSSTTSSSSTARRCQGISSWWDSSIDRHDRMMVLWDNYSPYATASTNLRVTSEMQAIIGEQQRSNPPAAASSFSAAIVDYMSFAYSDVTGTGPFGYAWETENDRLFTAMERTQRAAADGCNITLTVKVPARPSANVPTAFLLRLINL